MTKHITFLLYCLYLSFLAKPCFTQSKTLYYDDNGILVTYELYDTGEKTYCNNPVEELYTDKAIHIWKISAKMTNNSGSDIKITGFPIVSMDVGVRNGTVFYCGFDKKDNVIDGMGMNHKPWFSIKTDAKVLAGKSYSNTTYIYLYEGEIPEILSWDIGTYYIIKKKVDDSKKDADNFWRSNPVKEKITKKNIDSYWSGSNDEKRKQSTDFWNGRGTMIEEKSFEENTRPDNSDQFIGNVRSRTNRVRIFCEDTGQQDGDLVRIINNGKVLKDNIYLTNEGRSYWFELNFGQNAIVILALNQGDVGANTAAFKVYDDKGNLIAEKSWNLQTGYKGKLLILKI